jgi:hypothetical protein
MYFTEREINQLQFQAAGIADGLRTALILARPSQIPRKSTQWDRDMFEILLESVLEKTEYREVYDYLRAQAIIHARSWYEPEVIAAHKQKSWEAERQLLEGASKI